MFRDAPFAVGETYHVFNRGAHKEPVFNNEEDYRRFLLLLRLANRVESINMRKILTQYKGRSFANIFQDEDSEHPLVDLYGYCLMPNHFHLILREKIENGISSFLKKVLTGYSMYFNTKYEHSGVLFQGRFKSSHIANEPYFRYIFTYVHLNSLDLIDSGWKEKGLQDYNKVRNHIKNYPYSSFVDYSVSKRPETSILSTETAPDFLKTQNDIEELIDSFAKDRPLHALGIKEV